MVIIGLVFPDKMWLPLLWRKLHGSEQFLGNYVFKKND